MKKNCSTVCFVFNNFSVTCFSDHLKCKIHPKRGQKKISVAARIKYSKKLTKPGLTLKLSHHGEGFSNLSKEKKQMRKRDMAACKNEHMETHSLAEVGLADLNLVLKVN